MLEVSIPDIEAWDDSKEEFVTLVKGRMLTLEHSLISISKWECKWHKPFLTDEPKTDEESIDYIKCMTLDKNVDSKIYKYIPSDIVTQIYDYIQNPMTATTFNNFQKKSFDRTIITNEVIYGWMVSLQIPCEFEKWHLNRLLTLIRVCEAQNTPSKKMNKKEVASMYSELNAVRRKKYNTKG